MTSLTVEPMWTCSTTHRGVVTPTETSSFLPPGFASRCPERGRDRNHGGSQHHHRDHAHEHARSDEAQQAFHGLHLGVLHQEHPVYGQGRQPHGRVDTSVEKIGFSFVLVAAFISIQRHRFYLLLWKEDPFHSKRTQKSVSVCDFVNSRTHFFKRFTHEYE